ncbi:hypothetical protein [Vibrio palustris]|uniref:Uncharacterized protein n=1 Tax=Vibrio palustris TaxID=1918946 RepID=A0A1R4B1M8_9VIBR|nr:hypothetical protein [Vibrio palustris]SJL82813.1 hypothetical protein VPAL9027_00753 [Vibrio palustris]
MATNNWPRINQLEDNTMDRDFLAHKLYCERVRALIGDDMLDNQLIERCWESKMSPSEAVRSLSELTPEETVFSASPWLQRYLSR